ncbi:arginase [Colletotrichum tamarilloi]|uniref:Arginase n=1 Tax=Colletotrichum tamarilloi TaxID=1209934 RepID=A0ABQ9R7I9_9PEZI|nr:arginase [Colletotrichum tamarilloi]KAK1497217.1 arginase [Colletotrichum tamarilloi]
MRLFRAILLVLLLFNGHAQAHERRADTSSDTDVERLKKLHEKWDTDWPFSGISTFAHLQHVKCLTNPDELFDVGIIGAPFDTAVSYRPGARFGPRAIRAASARQTSFRGFNHRAGINPYSSWAKVLDCGDIPITPFDNKLALHQMTLGYHELLSRPATNPDKKPVLLTLGGDHSVALPALRALRKAYQEPIAVLHFDAHMDTLHPNKYPSTWTTGQEAPQSDFTHGTMFWIASFEGLIRNGSSVHCGLRSRLAGDDFSDYEDDSRQGFMRIEADDIDLVGAQGIIDGIMKRMGTEIPVYMSVDIDVIDPGLAPGTGTPEPGGWTTRELLQIIRGVGGLNIVGAEVVEVSPAFDGRGEETALAAAQVIYEMLSTVVLKGMEERGLEKPLRTESWTKQFNTPIHGNEKDEL